MPRPSNIALDRDAAEECPPGEEDERVRSEHRAQPRVREASHHLHQTIGGAIALNDGDIMVLGLPTGLDLEYARDGWKLKVNQPNELPVMTMCLRLQAIGNSFR